MNGKGNLLAVALLSLAIVFGTFNIAFAGTSGASDPADAIVELCDIGTMRTMVNDILDSADEIEYHLDDDEESPYIMTSRLVSYEYFAANAVNSPLPGVSYGKTLNSAYYNFGSQTLIAMIKLYYANGDTSEYTGSPSIKY